MIGQMESRNQDLLDIIAEKEDLLSTMKTKYAKLEKSEMRLREQVVDLQGGKDILSEQGTEKDKLIDYLSEKIKVLQREREEEIYKHNVQAEVISSLNSENKNLRSIREANELQIEKLNIDKTLVIGEMTQMQEANNGLDREVQRLLTELKQSKVALNDLNEEAVTLRTEKLSLAKMVRNRDNIIKNLTVDSDQVQRTYEARILTLIQNNEQLLEKVDEVEKQVRQFENSNIILSESIDEKDQSLSNLRAEKRALQRKLSKTIWQFEDEVQKRTRLQEQLTSVNGTLQNRQGQIMLMAKDLNEKNHIIKSLKEEEEETRKELSHKSNLINRQKLQIRLLRDENGKVQMKYNKLLSSRQLGAISNCATELFDRQKEIKDLNDNNESLERTIASKDIALTQLENEAKELIEDLNRKNTLIQDLEQQREELMMKDVLDKNCEKEKNEFVGRLDEKNSRMTKLELELQQAYLDVELQTIRVEQLEQEHFLCKENLKKQRNETVFAVQRLESMIAECQSTTSNASPQIIATKNAQGVIENLIREMKSKEEAINDFEIREQDHMRSIRYCSKEVTHFKKENVYLTSSLDKAKTLLTDETKKASDLSISLAKAQVLLADETKKSADLVIALNKTQTLLADETKKSADLAISLRTSRLLFNNDTNKTADLKSSLASTKSLLANETKKAASLMISLNKTEALLAGETKKVADLTSSLTTTRLLLTGETEKASILSISLDETQALLSNETKNTADLRTSLNETQTLLAEEIKKFTHLKISLDKTEALLADEAEKAAQLRSSFDSTKLLLDLEAKKSADLTVSLNKSKVLLAEETKKAADLNASLLIQRAAYFERTKNRQKIIDDMTLDLENMRSNYNRTFRQKQRLQADLMGKTLELLNMENTLSRVEKQLSNELNASRLEVEDLLLKLNETQLHLELHKAMKLDHNDTVFIQPKCLTNMTKQHYEELQNLVNELNGEVESINTTLTEKLSQLLILQFDLKEKDVQIEDLQKYVDYSNIRMRDLSDGLKKTKDNLQDMSKMSNKKARQIKNLKIVINDLKHQVRSLKNAIQGKNVMITELQLLLGVNETLNDSPDEYIEGRLMVHSPNKDYGNDTMAAQKEIMESHLNVSLAQILTLKQELNESKLEINRLQMALNETYADIQELQHSSAYSDLEFIELQKQFKKNVAIIANMTNEIKIKDMMLESVKRELNQSNDLVLSLENKALNDTMVLEAKLKSESNRLQQINVKLQNEISQKDKLIKETENSKNTLLKTYQQLSKEKHDLTGSLKEKQKGCDVMNRTKSEMIGDLMKKEATMRLTLERRETLLQDALMKKEDCEDELTRINKERSYLLKQIYEKNVLLSDKEQVNAGGCRDREHFKQSLLDTKFYV